MDKSKLLYSRSFNTPYGTYSIVSTGDFVAAKPVDTTPISSGSPVNQGGFDVLHENDFIIKCVTESDAIQTLKDILRLAHRYKLEI